MRRLALAEDRPETRADCEHVPRPCPWKTCRYHLDPDGRGATESCTLDVVDQSGPMTLAQIADIWGVSRERIRQIESRAVRLLLRRAKYAAPGPFEELVELLSDDTVDRMKRGK